MDVRGALKEMEELAATVIPTQKMPPIQKRKKLKTSPEGKLDKPFVCGYTHPLDNLQEGQ